MPARRSPDSVGEIDRRLREVAQLRKLWRAFRDPQERRDDEERSHSIVATRSRHPHAQEPTAAYGSPTIRAALRHWWCHRDYAAMVALGRRLDPRLFEEEPLVGVYLDAATKCLSEQHIHPDPTDRPIGTATLGA
jgi:hypothetical protein